MKIVLRKSLFNILLLLCATAFQSHAQEKRLKTIEKEFSNIRLLKMAHRHGPLHVKPSTDGRVYIAITLSVKAKDNEDFQAVFNHFHVDAREQDGMLRVKTDFETSNWNTNNGKSSIRFKDGTKVRNLRDLEISCSLFIPNNMEELFLENKYDEIIVAEKVQPEAIRVNLYSGRASLPNVRDVKLDLKYSKVKIGSYKAGYFDVYESDITSGKGDQLSLRSKYGKHTFEGVAGAIDIDSYEDKIKIGSTDSRIMIRSKYTTFELGNIQDGLFDLYESNITALNAANLQFKSKYGNYKFSDVANIVFESSYEDEFDAQSAHSLVADSKYGKFTFGMMKSKVKLKSYEDKLQISSFVGPFEGVDIDGKYTNATLNLQDGIDYQINASMKYGKLEYDESKLQNAYYKEKGDQLDVKGKTLRANDQSPLIKLNGYECNVYL
ncbi:MAG: hypothetical protein MK226_09965 [Saprospiraceae bacterium]|nr:hypothetical protein [Saprospiraceae bacterium]